jgi:hypothetical protein
MVAHHGTGTCATFDGALLIPAASTLSTT